GTYDPARETVLLYLGKLTVSKGAEIYARLAETFGITVHFFGQTKDRFSEEWVHSSGNVVAHGNRSSGELKAALKELSQQYNLIGLSTIIPENESYALQEANKDIDYMCLGIPFVGNERVPTFEKIQ